MEASSKNFSLSEINNIFKMFSSFKKELNLFGDTQTSHNCFFIGTFNFPFCKKLHK